MKGKTINDIKKFLLLMRGEDKITIGQADKDRAFRAALKLLKRIIKEAKHGKI